MPFRLYRRKQLFPGVRLNVSKSGPSVTVGGKGVHYTVGPRGRRTTIGVPGTGVYYTTQQGNKAAPTDPAAQGTSPSRTLRMAALLLIALGFILAFTPIWVLGLICLFAGAGLALLAFFRR